MSKVKFPKRINVHFKLNIELSQILIESNSLLVKYGSEINFSHLHIPHCTIIMGEVSRSSDYIKMLHKLSKISTRIEEFDVKTSKPYLALPQKKYIFIDVKPKEILVSLKLNIYNEISDYINLDFHGRPDNTPHITIGYISKIENAVKSLNQLKLKEIHSKISNIGISTVSTRGTCLEELASFELVKSVPIKD